jgi:hypothetical protein
MKKFMLLILVLSVGYLVSDKLVDVAYSLGFAELKKETILVNQDKLKVKCRAYALGFFDEIKLENNFQQCVNQYQQAGYQIVEANHS